MLTYYAASYWHRDCDPSSVAVSLAGHQGRIRSYSPLYIEVKQAMAEEEERCSDVPEDEFIEPDIRWSGVHQHHARDLFTAAELREHRRDLMNGQVVWLSRG